MDNSYSSAQSSVTATTVHQRHSAIPKVTSTIAHLGFLPSSTPPLFYMMLSSFSFCGPCFLYGTTRLFNHPLQPIYNIAFLRVPFVIIGLLHPRVFSAGLPVKTYNAQKDLYCTCSLKCYNNGYKIIELNFFSLILRKLTSLSPWIQLKVCFQLSPFIFCFLSQNLLNFLYCHGCPYIL